MPEPINSDLAEVTIAAVVAARKFVHAPDRALGYVTRHAVTKYKVNDSGWPSTVANTLRLGRVEDPMDWNRLIGQAKSQNVRFDPDDVPELRAAIDFVLSQPGIIRRVSGQGERVSDETQRKVVREGDVIRLIVSIIERAEALGITENEGLLAIYCEIEHGLLSEKLQADLIFPLALVGLELDQRLELAPGIALEPLDENTQRGRAPDVLGGDGINPYLVAAATHAVVLENRSFENPDGPLIRQLRLELNPIEVEEAEQVCQALRVLSGRNVGYAQVCLRPIGWADGWTLDLPALEVIHSTRRYAVALDNGGWNRPHHTVGADVLADLSRTYAALSGTSKRGQLAARKLQQTAMREQEDDIILDACIGIEALLGEEHDELVHRMGLRAAVALSALGRDPQRSYELLKKVYGHRSKIVHGTEPKESTIVIGKKAERFATSRAAVALLGEILKAHLTSTPPWTPAILDEELFEALRSRNPAQSNDAAG